MSNKAKKRKVSEEPVLQDYTVTSFSDLNPDGPAPPDESLFNELKNYTAQVSEITFNLTNDINLTSGPYPSDSSLDSICKPESNRKSSKHQRLFQRKSKKRSMEDNLFDSCLKNSFSDHSVEKVNKLLKKKVIKNVRDSLFDSDLESTTPVKHSPFKKPLQRKSKIQQKPNLFDSLVKDSQPNTPEESLPRQSKRVSSNCSIAQPSPFLNIVTRMKKRLTGKKNDSNLFDEDFDSSQSDASMTLKPLGSKHKTVTSKCSNDSKMFDDLLDGTDNESQVENECENNKISLPGPVYKNNDSNYNSVKSFSLEYNAGDSSDSICSLNVTNNEVNNITNNEVNNVTNNEVNNVTNNEVNNDLQNKKPLELDSCHTDCTKSMNLEYNEGTGKSVDSESKESKDQEAEGILTELSEEKTASCNRTKTSLLNNEIKYEEEIQNKFENTLQVGIQDEVVLEHKIEGEEMIEYASGDEAMLELTNSSEETQQLETECEETEEDTLEEERECEETSEQETEGGDEEALDGETEGEDEETLHQETEGEDEQTLHQETDDEEDTECETEPEKAKEFDEVIKEKSEYVAPDQSNVPEVSALAKELQSISAACSTHPHFIMGDCKNMKTTDQNLTCDGSAEYFEIVGDKSQSLDAVSAVRESNLVESIHINAKSLDNRTSLSCMRKMSTFAIPIDDQMTIMTPDASFKDMPSSTPKVKGKRVSFFVEDFDKPSISHVQVEETCLAENENNRNVDITVTRRKSSLRSLRTNDSRNSNSITVENSRYSRQRRVSFKVNEPGSNTSKRSNSKGSDKHLVRNQSDNCYSSVSLESLVYAEGGSGSRTLDSESVYIDIHPSRGKSTSSSNTESVNGSKSRSDTEKSACQAKYKSFTTCRSSKNNIKTSKNEETDALTECSRLSQKPLVNSVNNSYSVGGIAVKNTEDEEYFSNIESGIVSKDEFETLGNESEDEKSGVEADENEESGRDYLSEYETEVGEGEEKESEVLDDTDEEELDEKEEPNSEEEQNQMTGNQESEHHSIDSAGFEDYAEHTISTHEQDENKNPHIPMFDGFKVPLKMSKTKKKVRTSSLFLENPLNVPSKSQLRDILHRIPFSELKKKKRKLSQNCISREQMQQYEIEEDMLRNRQKKKTLKTETASFSGKLKRPKKWVTPKLYDFLISKLKPQFGIRSRVRAEELVLLLAELVECIKMKKELLREDVDKMKTELARLQIVKTHWDFFQFVNKYFDYHFKEKMYPSLPGSRSAFEFGPTNVMENIMVEI